MIFTSTSEKLNPPVVPLFQRGNFSDAVPNSSSSITSPLFEKEGPGEICVP
jgi:hypothetical protein